MTGTLTARSPRRTPLIPALPRPARVVLGGDFISAVGSGLTLPCLFIYAHQVRELSDGVAGLVVATIALASLAGNPLGGAMADRWTPRRVLMTGLTVAAAGSVALAAARSAAALFGAAALLGLGVAMSWPAQDALLASLAGPAGRSAVFSIRHASMNAGLGLGALGAAAVVSVTRPCPPARCCIAPPWPRGSGPGCGGCSDSWPALGGDRTAAAGSSTRSPG